MRGHLGQYVIVIPEDQLIIVRLGNKEHKKTNTNPHSEDLFVYLDESYKMLGKNYQTELPDNREKILQQLLSQNFPDVDYT